MLFGQEHVQRYVETDGEVGHEWQGVRTLILHDEYQQRTARDIPVVILERA
jgi:hypothetical protein